MNINLRVDQSTLSLTSGAISGKLCLDVDGRFFPDESWNDLVLPFATEWLVALREVRAKPNDSHRVYFMDGPFAVDLSSTGSTLVTLELVERRLHEEVVVRSVEADHTLVLRNALDAAVGILKECRARGWETPM